MCGFVDLPAILVWLWLPKFAPVAIGSDPRVTQVLIENGNLSNAPQASTNY